MYHFVKNILAENVVVKRSQFFLVLICLFLFILICNLGGLLPYSYTLTSSFIVTFFFALTYFIGLNLVSVFKQG